MKYKKISNFEINERSPFVDKLLEIKTSKRRKLIAGRHPNMVVNSATGEVEGIQTFAIFEEVDEEKFTKVYKAGMEGMYGLSKAGVKVFSYIASVVKPNKDEVIFEIEDCKDFTGYKTSVPIMTGLSELIENNFIARSKKHYRYFINPAMFFNGSRVAFLKVYLRKNDSISLQNGIKKIE